jgi:biotin carboxylase
MTSHRQNRPRVSHLLVVGDERDIVARARELDPELRTSVLCAAQEVGRVRDFTKHSRVVVLDDRSPLEEWVAASRFVHAADTVDRIVCFGEEGQRAAAAIADELGLAWHSGETVRAVDSKWHMRQRLAEAGVDDTPCVLTSTAEEIAAFGARVGYPLICKPAGGVGSQGVVRLDDADDIAGLLATTLAVAAALPNGDVLVEPFHAGREYSVECLSEDGRHLALCVTEKFLAPGGFVEVGHVLPARLTEGEEQRILGTVTAALDALGIREGVNHTEVIVTEREVRVVETHLRQAGDRIPYLLRDARGVDIVDALARQSIGLGALDGVRAQVEKAAVDGRFGAIWYATPSAAGEVLEVRGVEDVKGRPGISDAVVRVARGDRVRPITSSASRPAHVWGVADTPDEALALVRQAVADLKFVVAVPGGSS